MTSARVKAALAVLAMATGGCGTSPITSSRLETALEATFTNLVDVQVSRLGLPPMPARDFAASAICRRLTGANAGSGEWTCTLTWQAPDRRTVRDVYDLFVAADGCFTATANGEGMGGPTLTASDGRTVRNVLYVFEGCFDTT